ncbi:hypothetical protein K1719_005018 [Acacia pycnantha]|nr:hypothetical protein K1719_005018 [Acacia pycnantha]
MWFFILHGRCLAVEIGLKKQLSGTAVWLPRVLSGPLIIGFVLVTVFWLFLPQLLQCDGYERGSRSMLAAVIVFVKNATKFS